jgi:hypothetical protein
MVSNFKDRMTYKPISRKATYLLLVLMFLQGCLPEPLPVTNVPTLTPRVVVSSQLIPETGLVVFLSKSFGALDAGEDSDDEELLEAITITDALLLLRTGASVDTLQNLGSGLYGGLQPDWPLNTTYILEVQAPGFDPVYASTQVQEFVGFSNVTASAIWNGFDSLARVTYTIADPPTKNFYMLNVQRFSTELQTDRLLNPRIYTKLLDDAYFTSSEFSETTNVLFEEFTAGDSIAVSLANISAAYYQYLTLRGENRFNALEFAAEPVAYPTNVTGGYGFFNLHTPDVRLFRLE